MTEKCELGDCQNDAYLYVEMFSLTEQGAVFNPMPVCLDCYEEHGFKEY